MSTTPQVVTSSRQRFLLALLGSLGGKVGNLDFQKLLFLRCQEEDASATYEFVPYRYGAFSFTAYADRRKLVERGLLTSDEDNWELTVEGQRSAGNGSLVGGQMGMFAREYVDLRGDALVAETYRRLPYYATRSVIARRVLHGDRVALARIEASRPRAAAPGITTIGYERQTLEHFLNQLLRHGVTILCDVRRNAISRKYGFSKGTLVRVCSVVGLRYEHLSELGIDSDKRKHLTSEADYNALFSEYARRYLPTQRNALGIIKGWVEEGARVALTCYEQLPMQCHRHCVAEALEECYGAEFKPQHL